MSAAAPRRGAAPAPIAVTMGEPAGIGGEIALLAWLHQAADLPPFFLIDDAERIAALAAAIGVPVDVTAIDDPAQAGAVWPKAMPVLPVGLPAPVEPGRVDSANAPAVIESIDRAVAFVMTGEAAAVVTNPIQKSALIAAGFRGPGHTEYLAHATQSPTAPVMMLAGPQLRVVPVTIHLSLSAAVKALRSEDIVHCARITAQALQRDFGIAQPRLAVAGLNPHAGEDGALGNEETTIIEPALARLRSDGIDVRGPAAADTLFHAEARESYDAAICMYHDQALIPVKTLDFHRSVNVTLGLPIVRTSPDHGTALDIAGTGRADPTSFAEAIKLAARLAARRRQGAAAA